VAVYEGARPRSIFTPRRARVAEAPTLPRRRMRGAVRARRRSNRLSLLLGGIVVAFVLAFYSLAQSVRVSATGYDINNLLSQREVLLAQKQELLSDLNRLGREPAIRKLSIDAGLGQLAEPLVLTDR
jgi:ABC-type sugar transport system permease subunit